MPITAQLHWPEFMRSQASHARLKYPRFFKTGELELRYRIERRDVVLDVKEDGLSALIYLKQGFGWIHSSDQIIGALEFRIVSSEGALDSEFWWALDGITGDLADLAEAVNQCWEDFSRPQDYGPILFFEHMWIEPAHRNFAISIRDLDALFEQLAGKRYSVAVFTAAPDSHQVLSPNVVHLREDEAHQLALMQLYRRQYGFAAFPGKFGEDGMMWRFRPELVGVMRRPGIITEHWRER